jgi:hypothetical protein
MLQRKTGFAKSRITLRSAFAVKRFSDSSDSEWGTYRETSVRRGKPAQVFTSNKHDGLTTGRTGLALIGGHRSITMPSFRRHPGPGMILLLPAG